MGSLIDYVKWRGDLTLSSDPFNLIDNTILCNASYIDFSYAKITKKITLRSALSKVFKEVEPEKMVLGLFIPKDIVELAHLTKSTKRYGSIEVSDYVNYISVEEMCQFSAITYHLDDDTMFVAYRGTDDSLIGWQENLNMVSTFPVRGEVLAKEYLERIARKYKNKKIYVAGHSKGGTLALYASIYADESVKSRIINVFSNDGTGIMRYHLDIEKLKIIESRIIKIVPVDSVVGMFFDNICGKLIVVKSSAKKVYQHNMVSWMVEGNRFLTHDGISKNAEKLSIATINLIEGMTKEEREKIALEVYEMLMKMKSNTLTDIKKEGLLILKHINTISYKNKKYFMKFISNFIKYREI